MWRWGIESCVRYDSCRVGWVLVCGPSRDLSLPTSIRKHARTHAHTHARTHACTHGPCNTACTYTSIHVYMSAHMHAEKDGRTHSCTAQRTLLESSLTIRNQRFSLPMSIRSGPSPLPVCEHWRIARRLGTCVAERRVKRRIGCWTRRMAVGCWGKQWMNKQGVAVWGGAGRRGTAWGGEVSIWYSIARIYARTHS